VLQDTSIAPLEDAFQSAKSLLDQDWDPLKGDGAAKVDTPPQLRGSWRGILGADGGTQSLTRHRPPREERRPRRRTPD
jgi:hypothetical protein